MLYKNYNNKYNVPVNAAQAKTASGITKSLITSKMSEVEKAAVLYEYLTTHIMYNYSEKKGAQENTSITLVKLPEAVKVIESDAFSGCTKLKEINFVEYLSERIFLS